MDTLAVNKGVAAVLLAGIAYMGATILGDTLVHPKHLAQSVLKIEGAAQTEAPTVAAADAPLPPIAPLMASANPAAGEADTKKLCVTCHSFNEGGKALIGPNLFGVVGGPHAHMPGYEYSAAIKAKQGPWSFDELNAWLRKPAAYAPGTKMGFAGIADDKERADVIDYLHTLAHDPMPLPSADSAPKPGAQGSQGGNPSAGNGGASAAPSQTTPAVGAAQATTPPPAQGGPAQ